LYNLRLHESSGWSRQSVFLSSAARTPVILSICRRHLPGFDLHIKKLLFDKTISSEPREAITGAFLGAFKSAYTRPIEANVKFHPVPFPSVSLFLSFSFFLYLSFSLSLFELFSKRNRCVASAKFVRMLHFAYKTLYRYDSFLVVIPSTVSRWSPWNTYLNYTEHLKNSNTLINANQIAHIYLTEHCTLWK